MSTAEKSPSRFPRLLQRRREGDLIEAMREGEESAFRELVDLHHSSLLRLAGIYLPAQADAEEVAKEAWRLIFEGSSRFERRSSLEQWIFRVVVNLAKTRGRRENSSIPFSSAVVAEFGPEAPAVDQGRFFGPPDDRAGSWSLGPTPWRVREESLLSLETRERIQETIDGLPRAGREVMALRDIEGWTAEATCNAIGLSDANQRALLHRARSKVRGELERLLGSIEPTQYTGTVTTAEELTCKALVELVTDYLEDALPRLERRRFDDHARGCKYCSAYLDQIRVTLEAVGGLRQNSIEPEMREKLLVAFRAWQSEGPDQPHSSSDA